MVRFVTYTGEYPNLCSGNLTLDIDGNKVVFGDHSSCDHSRFWHSGGSVWFDDEWIDHVSYGEWEVEVDELPEQYREYAEEIKEVINDNIPQGCCGGCI